MKSLKKLHAFILLALSLSLAACAAHYRGPALLEAMGEKTVRTGQLLVVVNESCMLWDNQMLYTLEKREGIWRQVFGPMKAVVGKNGFAPPGEKREGDGLTPSGSFKLGPVFGYAPQANTRMPYRQALSDDLWVDDPKAPDYNRWVKQSETHASSYEKMRRDDDQYKLGVVIEYNTDPVIPGYGSAIFLHLWNNPRTPTAGCVAVSEEDLVKILEWLDPAAHPMVMINPDQTQKGTP